MAAPPEITLKDLTGKYVMNRTLSTDTDAILTLQGISWFVRKAIALSTVTLAVREYADAADPSLTHIDIAQTLTGGIAATPEARVLDWTLRPHKDGIFGDLVGRSRFVGVGKLKAEGGWDEVEWLGEGWEEGEGKEHVQSWVKNEASEWTANQVVEGKRYYCRKLVVKKGDKIEKGFLVYDYIGKVE